MYTYIHIYIYGIPYYIPTYGMKKCPIGSPGPAPSVPRADATWAPKRHTADPRRSSIWPDR